jgi:hypothetical protein
MINKDNLVKVKDHPNHYRDPRSKAILVVDSVSRQNYVNQKTLALRTVGTTERLQSEMQGMREELRELKDLLRSLVNNSTSDK